MNEIRSAFEKLEINEELKNRSLERLLEKSNDTAKGEKTMKRTFRMKKTIAVAAAAAAVLAMTVTAGAVISGIFHKEAVDTYLGSGAADELSQIQETKGKVITTATSVENGYFRITVDAVLSDGDRAVIYATKERLTNDNFGLGFDQAENERLENDKYSTGRSGRIESDWVTAKIDMEDGSLVRSYESVGRSPDGDPFSQNYSVRYERYIVYGIDPAKKLKLSYYDPHTFLEMVDGLDSDARQELYQREDFEEYRDSYYYPDYLQGLELTLDVSNNFNAAVFTDAEGREIYATPYGLYVKDNALANSLDKAIPFDIKAVSQDTIRNVSCIESAYDWDTEAQANRGIYFSLASLIKDPENIQSIEIQGVGTFTR